jgi:two-component system, NtrC family, sensor kinase
MKDIFFILISLLAGYAAFSQNVNIQQADSLRHELAKVKYDTSRAIILADLAEAYRAEKPDSTLYFADQTLRLSRSINFSFGEMRAYLVLCFYFQYTNTDLHQALESGLKALDIAQKNHFKNFEGSCLIRIGQVHLLLGNTKEAFNFFQKANQVLSDGGDPFFYAVTYWWLASTYAGMNNPDSALYMAKIGYDKAISIKNDRVLGQVLSIMGRVYAKKGENELAKQYYHQRIAAAERISEYVDIASGYLSLAFLFRDLKQNDSAAYYAKKAYELGSPRSFKSIVSSAAKLLSTLSESSDPAGALRYLKIANAVDDSFYNIKKIQLAQTLVFKEKEHQSELGYEKKAYKSRIMQYALLAGIGLLLFVLFALYRNNRNKQKANRALGKQKQKVEEALTELKSAQSQLVQKEKMASLGELTAGIAHEIQNPLNFVNNFSDINTELAAEAKSEIDKGNLEEVKAILNDIRDNEQKINHHGKRADAIVKGMLQHSQKSSGQKEPTDINALCDEYLRLSYHGLRAKDKSFNATLKTDFDKTIESISIISQDIGRVLLNLYNNAFYEVNEKAKQQGSDFKPTVSVSTKKISNKVEIKVTDNGNGIPQNIIDKIFQPFFTTKPTGQGTGLGLSLAYDIVKAHGGEIKVQTKENEGTEFNIQIRIA